MLSCLVIIKAVLQYMLLYLFTFLAAPKWVLKAIKNLQRDFLWGNMKQKRKWALIKWETIFHLKSSGGTRLRDPQHSNEVMGARIWWRWLSNPYTPWAILWTAKYAHNRSMDDLIWLKEVGTGSLIWNAAKKHKDLIQQHSFWEIRNGDNARFWEDYS